MSSPAGTPASRLIAAVVLALVGVALLAAGTGIWLDRTDPAASVVNTTTTTTTTKAASKGPAVSTVKVHQATDPATPTLRSESVVATFLGMGALLLLAGAGASYARISKITLPGGGGIEFLAPETQAQVVTSTATQAAAQGITLAPEQFAAVYLQAIAALSGAPATQATGPTAMGAGRRSVVPAADRVDDAVAAAIARVQPNRAPGPVER